MGQCGNGARCFARFVVDKGLTKKTEIAVETASGVIHPRLEVDGQVTVNMGVPNFAPDSLPFRADVELDSYSLVLNGEKVDIGAVSMGNPHAVMLVDDVLTTGATADACAGALLKSGAAWVDVLTLARTMGR